MSKIANIFQGIVWLLILYVLVEDLTLWYVASGAFGILLVSLLIIKLGIGTEKGEGREWFEIFITVLVFVFASLVAFKPIDIPIGSESVTRTILGAFACLGIALNTGHILGLLVMLLAKSMIKIGKFLTWISGQELLKNDNSG